MKQQSIDSLNLTVRQNFQKTKILNMSNDEKERKYHQILLKIQSLEAQFSEKENEFETYRASAEQTMQIKESRVQELQLILSDINVDLNAVKDEVQKYRVHIQNMEDENKKL